MLRYPGEKIQTCPLCLGKSVSDFYQDTQRIYFRCRDCLLIFIDPKFHLSSKKEKARYEAHKNSPEDPGYRKFLSRLVNPLFKHMGNQRLNGLDFGCGPGRPTLSLMLEEKGYVMTFYDPYFADTPSVLTRQYDFVTCTEAMEHFYTPFKEWTLLLDLLKPHGWLGIMTNLAGDAETFAQWYYKNDLTHVSFFSHETFRYLAKRDGMNIEFIGNDVILMRKSG